VAKDPMLKFISKPQAYPEKRAAQLRAEDFAEIAERYCVRRRRGSGIALFAMRRAILFGPLPVEQPYPRLVCA